MPLQKSYKLEIFQESDLLLIRHQVRQVTKELGFGIVDQTRILTAVSELTRNALIHGGGGMITIKVLEKPLAGVQIIIEDQGDGIEDIELALEDGYTTGTGLGNGLGGSRRLMDDFEIYSEVGLGTKIIASKWLI